MVDIDLEDVIDGATVIGMTIGISVARHLIQKSVQMAFKGRVEDEVKLSESIWKTIIYGVLCTYSYFVVFTQDFFWETWKCYINYPDVPITFEYKIWYLMQLGYYWSCFLLQHFNYDVKRKDDLQMLLHHICAITLISGSYVYGYPLLGGMLLCLDDINDFILNFGKVFNYLKMQTMANILFPIFLVTWIVTRLVLGTTKILYSSFYETYEAYRGPAPWHYYAFNLGLIILQVLNFYWFYLICQIAKKVIFGSSGASDIREEGEKENNKDEKPTDVKKNGQNGQAKNGQNGQAKNGQNGQAKNGQNGQAKNGHNEHNGHNGKAKNGEKKD